MCDLSHEETSQLWLVSFPRARKEHHCETCDCAILPGTKYARTKSLYDGYWSSFSACMKCHGIGEKFGKAHRLIPTPSSLVEYLDQCINERDGDVRRWQRYRREIDARRPPP